MPTYTQPNDHENDHRFRESRAIFQFHSRSTRSERYRPSCLHAARTAAANTPTKAGLARKTPSANEKRSGESVAASLPVSWAKGRKCNWLGHSRGNCKTVLTARRLSLPTHSPRLFQSLLFLYICVCVYVAALKPSIFPIPSRRWARGSFPPLG